MHQRDWILRWQPRPNDRWSIPVATFKIQKSDLYTFPSSNIFFFKKMSGERNLLVISWGFYFQFLFFSLHREMKSALMDCRWTCYSCLSCQSGSLSFIFFSFLQNFTHRKKNERRDEAEKSGGHKIKCTSVKPLDGPNVAQGLLLSVPHLHISLISSWLSWKFNVIVFEFFQYELNHLN